MIRPAAPALELADIQGDILRAYGNAYDCTSYAFVRIDCPSPSRRGPGSPACSTTSRPRRRGREKPLTTLNVALTASGLAALGVAGETIAGVLARVSPGHGGPRRAARRHRPERARERGRRAWAPATRTCC